MQLIQKMITDRLSFITRGARCLLNFRPLAPLSGPVDGGGKGANAGRAGEQPCCGWMQSGCCCSLHGSPSFGWKGISKHLTEFCNMELSLISFIYWTITVISVCFFSEAALLISLINCENQERPGAPSVDLRFRETWLQASLLPLVSPVIWNLFSYFLESQFPLKWEFGS